MPRWGALLYVKDEEVVADTLWGLAHFTDAAKDTVSLVLNRINVSQVLKYVEDPKDQVSVPALRVIGNLCAGSYGDIEEVLSSGALDALQNVLNAEKTSADVLKDVCWVLSNIATGSVEHIGQLISGGFIRTLTSLVRSSTNANVAPRGQM